MVKRYKEQENQRRCTFYDECRIENCDGYWNRETQEGFDCYMAPGEKEKSYSRFIRELNKKTTRIEAFV